MDRQTTFLVALGILIAAATVVGVCGWVMFARDRDFTHAGRATVRGSAEGAHQHEGREGS